MCLFDAVELGSKWHVLLSGILVANRVVTTLLPSARCYAPCLVPSSGGDIGCHFRGIVVKI